MWMLWAAAGAAYPWHGLSQVLDDEPVVVPPGIEATVVGLDAAALSGAVVASLDVLDRCSMAAAQARGAQLPIVLSDDIPVDGRVGAATRRAA